MRAAFRHQQRLSGHGMAGRQVPHTGFRFRLAPEHQRAVLGSALGILAALAALIGCMLGPLGTLAGATSLPSAAASPDQPLGARPPRPALLPAARFESQCDTAWPDSDARARVVGTGSAGLRVRTGPGSQYDTRAFLRNGALVHLSAGPVADGTGGAWDAVALTDGSHCLLGWSDATFLDPESGAEDENGTGDSPILGWVVPMEVTAYSAADAGSGAPGALTRSGLPAQWGVVAVDPQVIPLGTQVAIEGFGTPFIAADTGEGITGSRLDIFMPTEAEAVAFGVQSRDVLIPG